MRRGTVSETIPAPSAEVFDLVHDYDRRLQWDTLLRAAYLTDGHTRPGMGATSVCVGRRSLGGFALKTKYISFQRPKVAAVTLVNAPPFFEKWAASIQHIDLGARESRIVYTFGFSSKPRFLRWLFEPIMGFLLRWETQKRLRALRSYFAER